MSIKSELEIIRKQNRGVLHAEQVVLFATDPGTELHSRFTWDDSKAAYEYRLEQARRLIRVVVNMIPQSNDPVKAYVSLYDDRNKPAGGYRTLVSVLKNPTRRAALLAQALSEFDTMKQKYGQLSELALIFDEIDKIKARKKSA